MTLKFDHMTLQQRYASIGRGRPFCICQRTRQGVKFFEVSDMRPGGRNYQTATKREATKLAKQIEADYAAALGAK